MNITQLAEALGSLERTVAAVKGQDEQDSTMAHALATLRRLSHKEAIPLAIVGGLAAIYHGYERYTKDIDIVVRSANLDILTRIAPRYGIKVIWHDPQGWHKLQCEGIAIDVIPEGGKPRKDAPTTIPSPDQLGVREGAEYANLAGWMETKLGSNRIQDQADIVRVLKVTPSARFGESRAHLVKVHAIYLQRFEVLLETATEEMEQERERGGTR